MAPDQLCGTLLQQTWYHFDREISAHQPAQIKIWPELSLFWNQEIDHGQMRFWMISLKWNVTSHAERYRYQRGIILKLKLHRITWYHSVFLTPHEVVEIGENVNCCVFFDTPCRTQILPTMQVVIHSLEGDGFPYLVFSMDIHTCWVFAEWYSIHFPQVNSCYFFSNLCKRAYCPWGWIHEAPF